MNHRNHIDFDMLYRLAECVEEEQPFDDAEAAAMEHIADCKECYGKFCSLAALVSVTSDSGYMALSGMFAERKAKRDAKREGKREAEGEGKRDAEGEGKREAKGENRRSISKIGAGGSRVMAVISIAIRRAREAVSVRMEQVGQEEDGIIFEAPLAVAARDVSGHKDGLLNKLEDIENERNFVAVDSAEQALLVQMDARGSDDSTAAYLILEGGERIDIPLARIGAVRKGKIDYIPEGEFKLYLEK